MIKIITIIEVTFHQYWKTNANLFGSLLLPIGAIGRAAIVGWFVSTSNDAILIDYVFYSAPLMAIWFGVILVGRTLADDFILGTMDYHVIARVPILLVFCSRVYSRLVYFLPSGIIAFFTILVIIGDLPTVQHITLLSISILVALFSLMTTAIFFIPFMVLSGLSGGFLNILMPFVSIVGGFIMPTEYLPWILKYISYIFPTSWAMNGVLNSIMDTGSTSEIYISLLISALISMVLIILTSVNYRIIEKRVRIIGILQT